jgi:hypothetical protein
VASMIQKFSNRWIKVTDFVQTDKSQFKASILLACGIASVVNQNPAFRGNVLKTRTARSLQILGSDLPFTRRHSSKIGNFQSTAWRKIS